MSTYSPSLRIQLINTGDQAGTWGNTTNVNMGTLIESAIAGYISVSITSANQALTALDGAADQSRNMTLALTTTTAANFNVYAPPAEKTYVIDNTSIYTATIYNSTVLGNTTAAGAGVAIPAGRTVTVWTDGTNFLFQNDHLDSLTLATDLAIADGGTGASTAANARTNLGLGSIATQNANAVAITGGSITGITDLAVADGGTGASSFTSGGLLRGNGASALSVASAADIVAAIGSTAVTNATNASVANSLTANAIAQIYPVGSVYINATNGTNPASLFGFGTWVSFGAGRVPIGFNAGDSRFDTAEETGGSYDAVLPSHSHTWSGSASSGNTDLSHTHGFSAGFSGTTSGQSNDHAHSYSGTTAGAGDHQHYAINTNATDNPNQYVVTVNTSNSVAGIGSGGFESYVLNGQSNVANAGLTSVAGNHSHSFSGTTGGVNSNHTHTFSGSVGGTTGGASVGMSHNHSVSVSGSNSTEGVSAASGNIQPYITVYMWKRTA